MVQGRMAVRPVFGIAAIGVHAVRAHAMRPYQCFALFNPESGQKKGLLLSRPLNRITLQPYAHSL